MSTILAVIGQNGSGKDEVVKYLNRRYGIPLLSTGEMVRQIAAEKGIEPTRPNLQQISEEYFREKGRGCFVRLMVEQIKKNGWPTAGITGIRSPEDVKILKDAFGKDFFLFSVYVTDPKVRFQRMTRRAEERDPASYEQFLANDRREEEIFHISQAARLADVSLNNDGTLEELHQQVEEVIAQKKLLPTGNSKR